MLTAAAVLMAGYFVIDRNNLFADTHDFNGQVGTVSSLIDSVIAEKNITPVTPTPFNVVGVRGIAAWFIATGVMAGITAKNKQFKSHRKWAARHVGAGLWVAVQRPVYSVIRAGASELGVTGAITPDSAFGNLAFADAFYIASYLATFLFFGAAEWIARGEWVNEGTREEEIRNEE